MYGLAYFGYYLKTEVSFTLWNFHKSSLCIHNFPNAPPPSLGNQHAEEVDSKKGNLSSKSLAVPMWVHRMWRRLGWQCIGVGANRIPESRTVKLHAPCVSQSQCCLPIHGINKLQCWLDLQKCCCTVQTMREILCGINGRNKRGGQEEGRTYCADWAWGLYCQQASGTRHVTGQIVINRREFVVQQQECIMENDGKFEIRDFPFIP